MWVPFLYAVVPYVYNWFNLLTFVSGSNEVWETAPMLAYNMGGVWILLSCAIVWTTYS